MSISILEFERKTTGTNKKRKIPVSSLILRRAKTNICSSDYSSQVAEDHLSRVADGAVETLTRENERDRMEIRIAGDLNVNVTIVAWITILHCHTIFSSSLGRPFSI